MQDVNTLYPLLLEPTLHIKVWGGRRLAETLNKTLPTSEPYGESWELHDTARVVNGPLAGQTLGDLLAVYGSALVGPDTDPAEGFPLLAKLIDAQDWLSIQVHPDNDQARQLEGEPRGKTEAWYILAADPGAQLVIGLKPGTTRESMTSAICSQTLEKLLVYVDVTAGDVLFMPAGTVHAIGAGILIYEIQQSSDITYRLYDWGRVGLDGQPRELHIKKGSMVSNLDTLPQVRHTGGDASPVVELVSSPYFQTVLHQPTGGPPLKLDTQKRRFHVLTCIEGQAVIAARTGQVPLIQGQTVLIPAQIGAYTLSGTARILRSLQAG